MDINLDLDIYELGFGKRTLYVLSRNGIITLGNLLKYNHYTLSKLDGVGDKIIGDIVYTLKRKGLHLGMK